MNSIQKIGDGRIIVDGEVYVNEKSRRVMGVREFSEKIIGLKLDKNGFAAENIARLFASDLFIYCTSKEEFKESMMEKHAWTAEQYREFKHVFGCNIDRIRLETEHNRLSIKEAEIDLVKRALNKFGGRRKKAASELGMSERTLYRKIKQYDLDLINYSKKIKA